MSGVSNKSAASSSALGPRAPSLVDARVRPPLSLGAQMGFAGMNPGIQGVPPAPLGAAILAAAAERKAEVSGSGQEEKERQRNRDRNSARVPSILKQGQGFGEDANGWDGDVHDGVGYGETLPATTPLFRTSGGMGVWGGEEAWDAPTNGSQHG